MAGSGNAVVIVSAARTPVGSFNGALSGVAASYLGTVALKAAMARAGLEGGDIDEVILGQVLAAGQGQNPARQAAIHAGLDSHPKVTLHDYPGLDHGFAAEMGDRRDEAGAQLADSRTRAFLAANLA